MAGESRSVGMADDLVKQVRAILPECRELRRRLHSHPELSMKETETARSIAAFLSGHGLEPAGYDFPSVICDTGPDPALAIRADMDALPVLEASSEPFSSRTPGVMHACGHDAHSAILASAGVLLSKMHRSVRLIFQPAEEIGKGAQLMLSAGALDGIESIFGLHVWPSIETGKVAILEGPAMAANALFTVKLEGSGGHGAYPHLARDTITAAAAFIMSANTIVSRMIDPLDQAVLSFGQVSGGSAANVIPAELTLRGTIRSFSPETHARLKRQVEKMLAEVASSYGLDYSVSWDSELPAVINDRRFAKQCADAISPSVPVVECNPTMGSEDFAYYLQKLKGAFAFLGTGGSEETRGSKHSSLFRLDEDALYPGIMAEVLVGGMP